MKRKILSILLSLAVAVTMMPMMTMTALATEGDKVAKIGDIEYATLNDALNAAKNGNTVEIIKAGTYTSLPSGLNGFTILGGVDGVELDGSTCPSQWINMTVKNVTVSFGQENYKGFQHNSNLRFEECTFTGLHFSYGTETYYKCTFNQTKEEYNMWMYGTTVTYEECTFNCQGKCINVYNEGDAFTLKAIFKKCHFNSTKTNKSAVNVKETCGSTILKCDVSFEDCAVDTPEFFPTNKNGGSMLWMVDDLAPEGKGNTVVTVDGEKVWEKGAKVEISRVAKIGDKTYPTLAKAFEAAKAGDTIELLEESYETVNVTKDNISIAGLTDEDGKPVTNISEFKLSGNNVIVKDVVLTIPSSALHADNFTFDNCKFTGTNGIRYGYATGTCYIKNCEFDTTVYGIHFDGNNANVYVSNSKIIGFNTFASGVKMHFNNCVFTSLEKNQYCVCQTHGHMTITNSVIEEGWDSEGKISYIGTAKSEASAELSNITIKDSSKTVFDYVGAEHNSYTSIDATKKASVITDALFVVDSGEEAVTYVGNLVDKYSNVCKLDDTLLIAGNKVAVENGKLTAGYFNFDPQSFGDYVAENYVVKASDIDGFKYRVVKDESQEKTPDIVLKEKVDAEVSQDVPVEVQKNVEKNIGKAEVTGVAESLASNSVKQEAFLKKAEAESTTGKKIDYSSEKVVTIDITVAVEVKNADIDQSEAKKITELVFEATPYAKVSQGPTVINEKIKVDNNYLGEKTFKVIVPTVGLIPEQIIHVRGDDVKEAFKKGEEASYAEKTFKYNEEDETAVIEINQFSEIQVLGTKAYCDITFDPGEGTGEMRDAVKTGEEYVLPECTFTAPEGKAFAGWKIGDKLYAVGDKITISDDTTITAQWTKVVIPVDQVLLVKGATSGKKAVKLSWNTVDGAAKYVVYGNKCGKKFKKIKTTSSNSYKVKKIAGKKLKAHKTYKFYVVAYTANGTVKSNSIHFITGNRSGKYANVKSIKANASTVTLNPGATKKIGATYKMYYGKKHIKKSHGAALRYISDCPAVATVSSSGVVTAKSAGTATIYIQDIGGKYCKTTVTVK